MPVASFEKENQPVLSGTDLRHAIERAVAELQAKTAGLDAIIHFADVDWSVKQDAGTIVFERKDGMRATAPVQIIGTYNTADGTWLWAWDHPSVVTALRRDAEVVLAYGREHDIPALITRKVSCQETDCWEFTALACKLSNSQGAYRGPAGNTRVFMTFGKLRLGSVGADAPR